LDPRYVRIGMIISAIVAADFITKRWALDALAHGHTVFALDGLLPLTLAFNTGIAFGLGLPSFMGRWLIIAASVVIIFVLARLAREAEPTDHARLIAIALVQAGAIGNLIDRVRWDRGVVDFIGPYNLGFMYWPIFNIADMAITCGAVVLGVSLWREDVRLSAAERSAPAALVED